MAKTDQRSESVINPVAYSNPDKRALIDSSRRLILAGFGGRAEIYRYDSREEKLRALQHHQRTGAEARFRARQQELTQQPQHNLKPSSCKPNEKDDNCASRWKEFQIPTF
ncbi:hypothetical protein TcasGA2_TC001882 [Tribolium castaneum]|uniref:Uncharacterized protein n=1 Tax=Tribolium castaneum TaxID=7070 RepID=D7EJP3_TRICA|nr:hypothetical protein TcasGA2_TC001882 [Tribolium castaneum]